MTDEELIALVAEARKEGWYEDEPNWAAVDRALIARGFDIGYRNPRWLANH